MTIMTQLQELVTALDRRIPQVARAGEGQIAHDAAALRDAAVARLAQLAAAKGRTPRTAVATRTSRPSDAKPAACVIGTRESMLSFEPAYID